jgi:CRP/FNR family transcriptional regulator, cyclic AMP receptor protein
MDSGIELTPLFSSLDSLQKKILNEIIHIKEFKKNKIIFFEGDFADAFYIVQKGQVQIIKLCAEGKEKILSIMDPGDFFGEMGLIEGKKRSAMAKTSSVTSLIVLEKDKFLGFIRKNPEITLKIIVELSKRLRFSNQEVEELAFLDVESRLKRLFLRIAETFSDENSNEVLIIKKITHQEIGKLIASSRETVTRIINKMTEENLLEVKNNLIYLKNIDKW